MANRKVLIVIISIFTVLIVSVCLALINYETKNTQTGKETGSIYLYGEHTVINKKQILNINTETLRQNVRTNC